MCSFLIILDLHIDTGPHNGNRSTSASLKHILLLNCNKQLVTPSLTVANLYCGSGSGLTLIAKCIFRPQSHLLPRWSTVDYQPVACIYLSGLSWHLQFLGSSKKNIRQLIAMCISNSSFYAINL